MPVAYSYIRFSTPDQLKGDSLRRQSVLAAEYAARHGLCLSEESFRDLGVSGFNGAHVREGGGLQLFLQAIDSGVVEPGSYLLIENLDRLSRLRPIESINLLQSIVERGIIVVTLMDGQEYSHDRLQSEFGTFFNSVFQFFLSHQESLKKQVRLNEVWATKRKNKSTRFRLPMWLQRGENDAIEVKEPEATWVREIFRLASEGMGARLIGKTMKPVSGRAWPKTSVLKILRSREVIGEHQYRTGRGSKRLPIGDPVEGIFPPILSSAEFFAAQRTQAPSGPTKIDEVRNLFTGTVKCARCLSSLHLKRGSKRDKYERLVCSGQCGAKSIRYAEFEENVLPLIDDVVSELAEGQGSEERKKLAEIEGIITDLRHQKDRLAEAIAISDDLVAVLAPKISAVLAKLVDAEKQREDLEAEIRGLSTDNLSEVRRLILEAPTLPSAMRRRLRSLIAAKVPLILVDDDGVGIITAQDAKKISGDVLVEQLKAAAIARNVLEASEEQSEEIQPPKSTYH